MPGQPGADGKLRGGFVANFADDEHLRVLPQQMPRGAGEIEADGFVDLGLHRAGNDLLDGVFDGDDVASAEFGEMAEAGVNRRCLAAARRAGEQQQAGGLPEKMFEFGNGGGGQGQFAERFGRG